MIIARYSLVSLELKEASAQTDINLTGGMHNADVPGNFKIQRQSQCSDLLWASVLAFRGFYNKLLQTEWLKTTENHCLTVLDLNGF
jgi:hypothetical protein